MTTQTKLPHKLATILKYTARMAKLSALGEHYKILSKDRDVLYTIIELLTAPAKICSSLEHTPTIPLAQAVEQVQLHILGRGDLLCEWSSRACLLMAWLHLELLAL